MTTATIALRFDRQTCTRCGGSGNYSYNRMNGTVCFGCNGSKVTLTKKGKTQKARFQDSMRRPVETVAVGEFIFSNGKFRKVVSIERIENYGSSLRDSGWVKHSGVLIQTSGGGCGFPDGCMVEVIKNEAHRLELLRAAIEG